MKYQIFEQPPYDFKAAVAAAGCFCEVREKFLILKRDVSRPQGQTWGVPGGKLEAEESPRSGAIREVWEEVGLEISEGLKEMGTIYIRLPSIDYVFHMFFKSFLVTPEIQLNKSEYSEARWLTIEEALSLPLIAGGIETIRFYARWKEAL